MAVLIGSQPGATFALPQRDTLNYGAPASVAIGPTPTDITMNTGVTPGTTVATPYVPTANDVRMYLEARPDITDAQIVNAMNEFNVSPELVAQATGVNVADVTQRLNLANSQRVALDSPSGLVPASEIPISTTQNVGSSLNQIYSDLLGRSVGQEGMQYFTGDYERYLAAGATPEQAMANIRASVAASSEAAEYAARQARRQEVAPTVTPSATPTSMFDTSMDYMKAAAKGTEALTSYTPTDVTASTLPQVDISQYMNPYTQEVIDKSLADLERNRLMQQQTQAAQASAAGAFGGSRQGVAQALTNEAFARQAGQMASQLRQTGYTQAQQLAGTDLARQMQADLANQAMGLQGAQFRLGAQSQLGGMGLTGFNLAQQQYDQFMANEAMKQAMQNQLYAQQAGQATSFFGQPAQALGYLPGAISGMPYSQTTTAGRQPGAFDYLTLGAYMFA